MTGSFLGKETFHQFQIKEVFQAKLYKARKNLEDRRYIRRPQLLPHIVIAANTFAVDFETDLNEKIYKIGILGTPTTKIKQHQRL